jgi:peptidoglycan hydrolase-like protein with peptidoglycan-binding domain
MGKPQRTRIAIALLVVSAVIVPFTQTNPPQASANNLPPLGVIIRGHGNGHGRGLSQYGAFAWATRLGATWQSIIDFYYGGSGRTLTTLTAADAGATPGGVMSVRLELHDGKQVAAVSDTKTLSWVGRNGTYGSLIARPVATNTFDVYASTNIACGASTGTPSGFTLIGDNIRGPIDFVTTNGSNPAASAPADLVGVCEPATSTTRARIRNYRGGIRATVDGSNNHRIVNLVSIESYLRGVVPRESPAGWGDAAGGLGMHALRAQAVAARSYSLSESRYSYAKTCDTQNCQVYGGAALRTVGSSASVIEDSRTDRAIAETAGYVVKDSRNNIVRTEFTSSNGGRTASGTFQAKIDNGDITADAALQNWTRFISAAQLQRMYPSIGVFLSMSTTHDGLGGDFNGYTTSVTITGTAGSVTRSGWNFRGDFDLYAPWYAAFPVAPADPAAAPVGSILFIGDSVSESIATEFKDIVTPAFPAMTFQACSGRGMAGADCLSNVAAPQIDLDGVGIANALPAPAIAIVALGYNDDPNTFEAELQQMLSALSSKAVQRIIFVNMSTRATSRNYARSNQILANAAAANPTVTVLDWNAASSAQPQWRWFDNSSLCCWVHLSNSGQVEFALFLRTQLDALRAQGLLPTTAPTAALIPGLPLANKHRGAMVVSVQKKLNAVMRLKGSKRLATDGDYGNGTVKVVKAFQASVSLPQTGTVDRTTWDAMGLATRSDLAVLKLGSRHPAVSSVQRALAKVLRKRVSVTGNFTSSLTNDVKLYQKRAGFKQSGRVGPQTWASLMLAAASVR